MKKHPINLYLIPALLAGLFRALPGSAQVQHVENAELTHHDGSSYYYTKKVVIKGSFRSQGNFFIKPAVPAPPGPEETTYAITRPNRITTTILKTPITDVADIPTLTSAQKAVTHTYLDGLGRPIQSVAWQASPLQKDIITVAAYDRRGRTARHYLSYTSTQANGQYRPHALGWDDGAELSSWVEQALVFNKEARSSKKK